ncbi:MAG: hypothetical protein VYA80_00045 [Pseudomonadota bacterium]|nr:hypothetical protein [Pseudomonadota bacterium]
MISLRLFSTFMILLFAIDVFAVNTSTKVSGTFNNSQENACIHVSKFYFLTDCFYSRLNAEVGGQKLPWTGPTVNPVYYEAGSENANPRYIPVPGDERISPKMDGTITIDDQGTEDFNDDTISAEWFVGPAARSVVVNVNELAGGPGGAPPRAVMSWSKITHILSPTIVDSSADNEWGGATYVIASKGFPERLCRNEDPEDCYPSAYAGLTTNGQTDEGNWNGPKTVGVTRDTEMEGNVGASTFAEISDYKCVDNRQQITCPDHNVVWSQSEEPKIGAVDGNEGPGFDNLLLRVATNSNNQVISAEGYWTNEYFILGGPKFFQVAEGHDNSYQGGYLDLRGSIAN